MSGATSSEQLGEWVESLLTQVETRLQERNKQVVSRSTYRRVKVKSRSPPLVNEMSDRIDALEASIQRVYILLLVNMLTHAELVSGGGESRPNAEKPPA